VVSSDFFLFSGLIGESKGETGRGEVGRCAVLLIERRLFCKITLRHCLSDCTQTPLFIEDNGEKRIRG
jgi:hypothetical protein